ncbi:carboxypeptidase-like regulatory domain-containing protein [Lacibacter sp. MH-610]|uniref:carboxypeptidase-like regulatory domain-containing protein n=1 Tax=Lacibacter sp. MH-610 TaxID=3020883 RepID=UPI0038913621
MTPAEMHAFEKAMMDDPMLSDAVDGYRDSGTAAHQQLTTLAQELKSAPAKVVKGSFRQWLQIAAVLVVLLSAAVVLYRIFYVAPVSENNTLTVVKEPDQQPSAATTETKVDSQTIAVNEAPVINATPPRPVIIPPAAKNSKPVLMQEPAANSSKDQAAVAAPPPVATEARDQTMIKEPVKQEGMAQRQSNEMLKLNKFTGRVVDENNNPLPFANITEKNSGVGTYADVNGNFVLLSSDTVLNVQTRSLGYLGATAMLKGNSNQKIVLKDEAVVANAPTKETLYERSKKRLENENRDTTDEVMAEPLDGWSNYNTYVYNNQRNTGTGAGFTNRKQQSTKEVQLSFDVNPDGTITNIKVLESNCKSCNEEAIRLLKEGPRWKSRSGKKETSRFTIRF